MSVPPTLSHLSLTLRVSTHCGQRCVSAASATPINPNDFIFKFRCAVLHNLTHRASLLLLFIQLVCLSPSRCQRTAFMYFRVFRSVSTYRHSLRSDSRPGPPALGPGSARPDRIARLAVGGYRPRHPAPDARPRQGTRPRPRATTHALSATSDMHACTSGRCAGRSQRQEAPPSS